MNAPERPFDAPWQAQAFAMTVALHEQGLFTWGEWTVALSDALKAGGPDGAEYYLCWVVALEAILKEKLVTTSAQLADLEQAWHRAARATSHGQPICLMNDPEADPVKA